MTEAEKAVIEARGYVTLFASNTSVDDLIEAVRVDERAKLRERVEVVEFRDSVELMNFTSRATLELYREDVLALLPSAEASK